MVSATVEIRRLSCLHQAVVMRRTRAISLIIFCVTAPIPSILSVHTANAGTPPCSIQTHETHVRSTLASAGFFSNLRNAEHSINSQMDVLLEEARIRADQQSAPPTPCDTSCQFPKVAVVFRSEPHKRLLNYDEYPICDALYKHTRIHPIMYEHRTFSSEREAKKWYRDLTQGRGVDGKDLYVRCPGRCSPAYSSTAFQHSDKFIVSATIVCGHARDKDDDQYLLSASLRWICP